MKCPIQVNCHEHRQTQRAKDADRLRPKGTQSGVLLHAWNTRTFKTAGVEGRGKFIRVTGTQHCKPDIPPSSGGRRVRKER
jgi:hypothetical protein